MDDPLSFDHRRNEYIKEKLRTKYSNNKTVFIINDPVCSTSDYTYISL